MKGVATIWSGTPIGFNGQRIEVEADSSKGLPSLQIVGLAGKAVDEAKERVRSAIRNSLLEFPASRITINLSPAELPKDGALFDLPIALAILACSGQLQRPETEGSFFAGELALDGSLRPVRGIVSLAEIAQTHHAKALYVPAENLEQALLVSDLPVFGVRSLKELFLHLKGEVLLQPAARTPREPLNNTHDAPHTLDAIHGQEQAKRALIIAAAGHHNLLLSGPPGAGKTMLAKTLADLLPDLSEEEIVAVTKLHSLADGDTDTAITTRPFRTPHHTASRISLVGGGSRPQPGEISLAHLGVLFLDEMPEYPRSTLEALRQPMEDRSVTITRAAGRLTYPADFVLVGTMNPCPCGYFGDDTRECTCLPQQISNYQRRISGPLLDRIDIVLTARRIANQELAQAKSKTETQHIVAKRLIKNAQIRQLSRYKSSLINNGNASNEQIKQQLPLARDATDILNSASDRLGLTARGYFKVLRLARTIADIDDSDTIELRHITEALQYRQKAIE